MFYEQMIKGHLLSLGKVRKCLFSPLIRPFPAFPCSTASSSESGALRTTDRAEIPHPAAKAALWVLLEEKPNKDCPFQGCESLPSTAQSHSSMSPTGMARPPGSQKSHSRHQPGSCSKPQVFKGTEPEMREAWSLTEAVCVSQRLCRDTAGTCRGRG